MPFESIIGELMRKLEEEGRIKTLTPEQSFEIDHELAQELQGIKRDFRRKETNSRFYAAESERKAYHCRTPITDYQP